MTTYEKLSLLIQFSMLIVEVIRCFFNLELSSQMQLY
ncbi:putative holin-like toxin [Veillonella sp. 3891]